MLGTIVGGAYKAFLIGIAIWIAARIVGVRDATLLKSVVAALLASLGSALISMTLPEVLLVTVALDLLWVLALVMLFFEVDLRQAGVIAIIAAIGTRLFLLVFATILLGLAAGMC